MALYLVTGQPGHGKTAYAIDKAFQFQKEGRSIYAHGIKDFDYERAGWTYLEDPRRWEELPDGSVVLLDECYTVLPNRNPGAPVPAHIEAMARHRHRGFDFILIAQQGLQLDPFLRGLYEEHVHVRQTSVIRSKTKLKRWNQYQSNVQAQCDDVVDWIRPKYVFDYYTSTTLVTTKRTMPMWMRYLIAGVVFIIVILLVIRWHFQAKIAEFEPPARSEISGGVAGTVTGGTPGAGSAAPRTYANATEYAKAHLARFGTMPWTAPIYDGAAPVGQPELYCMSSLEGKDAQGRHKDASCSCFTEQGTKYELSQPECRTVARNGAPYNPYRQPRMPPAATPVQAPPVDGAQAIAGSVVGHEARSLGTFPESEPYESESYLTTQSRNDPRKL